MIRRILLALVCVLAGVSAGQDAEPKTIDVRRAPPSFRMGMRVLTLRSVRKAAPVLVIADGPAAYIRAIGQWKEDVIFPVLIDDGSTRAAGDIAKFRRAFKPERVVRISAEVPLPAGRQARIERIERALAGIWDVQGESGLMPELISEWQFRVQVPAGAAVADPMDPAWPAALALAAGHAEPIIWINRKDIPEGVDSVLGVQKTQALIAMIEAGLDESGLAWTGLDDAVDSVALCLNIPVKIRRADGKNKNEFFALTDAIGKHKAMESPRGTRLTRWAWAGQIFGGEARSAYAAMCSLFLHRQKAWIFDGYKPGRPWDAFDGTAAASQLARGKLEATVSDAPRQGIDTWRARTTLPLDADLVFVNSKGMPGWFDLNPGRGSAWEAPILDRPVAAHMVHSWSATRPGQRDTVAGAWLAHGAYAYIGSVHEPFLQAFVPTPTLALRLVGGLPWAAACRPDASAPVWKIAVIGDPLLTIGGPRERVEAFEIEGVSYVTDEVALAAKDEELAKPVRLLWMLGRDGEAVRLASALALERPEAFDADVAEAIAMPAFRRHDVDLLAQAVLKMGRDRALATDAGDALWHAAESNLRSGRVDAVLARALEVSMRRETIVHDTLRLAGAIEQGLGVAARNSLLARVEKTVNDPAKKPKLRQARH